MSFLSNFFSSLSSAPLSPSPSDEILNSTDNNPETLSSSSSMSETDQPITGICLIIKPTNVPPGYQCIQKSKIIFNKKKVSSSFSFPFSLAVDDQHKNADLMADSLLERKDRFLCITRAYPLQNNSALVLEDIKLIGEREQPIPPYQALTTTIDTNEKGTSKRTICVKFVQRQGGMKCICDIVFLYRSKRPPPYYTLIGEINGLQMCVKEGTVPAVRLPPANKGPSSSHLYPNVPTTREPTTPDPSHGNPMQKKSDEKEILDGIPFQINPKYLLSHRHRHDDVLNGFDSFNIFSSYELEQTFRYDFNLERASS